MNIRASVSKGLTPELKTWFAIHSFLTHLLLTYYKRLSYLLLRNKLPQNLVPQNSKSLFFFMILWIRNLGRARLGGSSAPGDISCATHSAGLG